MYSNPSYDKLIHFEVAEGRVPCADSVPDNVEAYAAKFNKIFHTKSVSYEIVGPRLKLSNENGDGVSFTAGTIFGSSSDSPVGTDSTIVDSSSDSSAGARNQCLGRRAPFSVMMAALLFVALQHA